MEICLVTELAFSVFWQSSEIPVFSEGSCIGSFVNHDFFLRVDLDINITRHSSTCVDRSIPVWALFDSLKPPFTGVSFLRDFCGFLLMTVNCSLSCLHWTADLMEYTFKFTTCFDVIIFILFCPGCLGGGQSIMDLNE